MAEQSPRSQPLFQRSSSHWLRWRRLGRYIYIRFLRLRSHPQAIARGLAAGVFAGSYPFFGLQTILGIALASAIRGNKVVAAAGTWISNPLTYVPIYAINYQIGSRLLGTTNNETLAGQSPQEWMELGLDVTAALLLGSTIMGIVLGAGSYFLGLSLSRRLRHRRQQRR